MADGGTEQGGSFLECRDAGQDLDGDGGGGTSGHSGGGGALALHLVDEGGHAIDAGIAAGDDHDGLALLGPFKSLFGPLLFALHARVYTLASCWNVWFNKLEIILITYDDISPAYCLEYGGSDVIFAARPYACYDNLSHSGCKDTK